MGHPDAFDRSLLPDTLAEIVILADTHEVEPDDPSTAEFASRKRQSARAERAFQLAEALDADEFVHLGDLVQEYPGGPGFDTSIRRVSENLKRHHPNLRLVAGNHDVGDKPDVRMPTHPATSSSLRAHHRLFGRSWYRFTAGPAAVYVLNSQIMNTGLAACRQQREWFEASLQREPLKRRLLFIHLPLFLSEPDEPDVGHYDNLAEPDRSWLLHLIRRHRFEAVFSGHVHTRFLDRLGRTKMAILGSPSFTRPGFGHMFASSPPPERGRDDRSKLGFGLLRIHARNSALHWIRTDGVTVSAKRARRSRVLTPTSSERSGSPLGFTLGHALASRHDIPMVWPSQIRQTVRNDHPMLALTEMGSGWVRTSWRDFVDPFQRKRLELLKSERIELTAIVDLPEITHCQRSAKAVFPLASSLELRLARGESLDQKSARLLMSLRKQCRSLIVSPVLPGRKVPGKQHARTATAWSFEELGKAREEIMETGLAVDRWRIMTPALPLAGDFPCGLDLTVEFTDNDLENLRLAVWGLAQVAAGPARRLSIFPLRDLDRTMDRYHGALDTLCNPRPVLGAVRIVNAILFPHDRRYPPKRRLFGTSERWKLIEPGTAEIDFFGAKAVDNPEIPHSTFPESRRSVYHLLDGTVRQVRPGTRPGRHTLVVSRSRE